MNYGLGIGSFADGFTTGQDMRKRNEQEDLMAQVQQQLAAEQYQPIDQTVKPAFTGSASLDQTGEESRRQQQLAQQRMTQAQQSQQQGQQGMNPSVGMGIMKSFMGGGASGAGGAAGGGAAGGGAAGGSAGGSAAGGMGSAAAAAGPWAALAAIIGVNEYNAKKGGYRAEDDKEYAKDLATGKVMSQDINQRWAPKLFGKDDKMGFGGDMKAVGEASHLDLHGTIDNLKNGSLGKIFKKLF